MDIRMNSMYSGMEEARGEIMIRKGRDEDRADISPELHARIVELSNLVWEGNRSRMARDVDIDQPTISRVLTGQQKPSAKLLEKLATWPGVNVGWFLLGQGEPVLAPGMQAGVGGYRPLLDELLPGPLAEHGDRLSGVSYPVAAAFDTKTSYWYRVQPKSPVTRSNHKVGVGDLLLVETDATWTRRGDAVLGKFCVFNIPAGKKRIALLAHVSSWCKSNPPMDPFEQYKVDTFGEPGEVSLIIPEAGKEEESADLSLSGMCVSLDQVVGACLKLERAFVREKLQPD
jgi:transcriptional regulator with XRE-family HTH domain